MIPTTATKSVIFNQSKRKKKDETICFGNHCIVQGFKLEWKLSGIKVDDDDDDNKERMKRHKI